MIIFIVIIIFITPVCACSCWPFVAVRIGGGVVGCGVKVAGLVLAGGVGGWLVGDGGEKKNKKKKCRWILQTQSGLNFCHALDSAPSSCSSRRFETTVDRLSVTHPPPLHFMPRLFQRQPFLTH